MRHLLLLVPFLLICSSSFTQSPSAPEAAFSNMSETGNTDIAGDIDQSSVGWHDLVKNKDLEVYPNPCTGLMVAKTSDPGVKEFSIMALDGRLVGQSKAKGKSSILDLTELPSGLYMVRAENPKTGYISQHKVVKQ